MMQRIECTKCGEVVELTGTSVTLPFICGECEEAQVFLDKISPSLQDFATNPTLISALKKQGYILLPTDVTPVPTQGEATVASAASDDDHDGATVENTNILIEDLKQRLRNAKDLFENSRQQVDNGRELNQELAKQLADAQAVARERDEVINKLTKANVNLWARIKNLRSFIPLMQRQITLASKQRTFWRDAARENENNWRQAVIDKRALKNRGLFARLLNKEPK